VSRPDKSVAVALAAPTITCHLDVLSIALGKIAVLSFGHMLPTDLSRTTWQRLGFIGLVFISGSSALAADEYYIVQDVSTKQCAVVDSPPTTTKLVLLDSGKLYVDRNEAERVMASLACTGPRSASASAGTRPNAVRAEGRAGSVKTRSRTSMPASPEPKPARSDAPVLSSREQLSPF
jgi:hypothetical protein